VVFHSWIFEPNRRPHPFLTGWQSTPWIRPVIEAFKTILVTGHAFFNTNLRKNNTPTVQRDFVPSPRIFVTAGKFMELSVRPLAAQDFDSFINYWLGLSPAEIERLGVAIDCLPTDDRMRSDLRRCSRRQTLTFTAVGINRLCRPTHSMSG
jgi:hypothetical protein